ncbi:MAG: hypothetical protein ACRDD1_10820, partial [Planctomycetia bacterium]
MLFFSSTRHARTVGDKIKFFAFPESTATRRNFADHVLENATNLIAKTAAAGTIPTGLCAER